MDLVSFGLGIASVAVVALVAVAVAAFFMSIKNKKEIKELTNIEMNDISEVHRQIGVEVDTLSRAIDSRIDKVIAKIKPV